MNRSESLPSIFDRVQRIGLIVGAVALVLSAVGFFMDQAQFAQSYLLGYMYWLQFAVASMAAVMLQYLIGARWGFLARRFWEAAAMTILLMTVLFIPILLFMQTLYPWANPEEVAHSVLLQHKEVYLNVPFFIGRAVFYFVVWIGLAWILNHWSAKQDQTGDPAYAKRLSTISPIGIILFMLTVSFATFDWMMSLEPEWFSSIYGVLYISGAVLAVTALVVITAKWSKSQKPFSDWATTDIFNDYGNYILGFVAFWAYISFSQYLIIWAANLPEEITWYIVRGNNGWQWIATGVFFFHFVVPWLLLFSRRNKRNIKFLFWLSVFLLVMRWADLFFLIKPAFYPDAFAISWMDVVVPLAIGGFWVAFFVNRLRQKPLLALNDPRFQEAPAHHD